MHENDSKKKSVYEMCKMNEFFNKNNQLFCYEI